MPVPSETIAALPPLQRRMAEAWLARFEENWNDQKLRECMAALPAQSSLRRPLLLAMIERDLSRQWESGRRYHVEDYLKDFPELGMAADLPLELIATEFKIRQQRGGADLTEFAERFPARIDDLYVLLKPGIFEGQQQPTAPLANDALAERRRQLLRAPAAHEPFESDIPEPSAAPRSSIPNSNATPLPSSNHPTWSATQALAPSSVPSMFLSPEPIRPQTPKSPPSSIPQMNRNAAEGTRSSRLPASAPANSAAPMIAAPMPPPNIGRYSIRQRLGSSNQGSNYLAVDTQLDRAVVLKVPRFQESDSPADRARFQSEAKAAAGWHNPMLCPVLDFGQANGIDYMVSSFLEGERLSDLIKHRPIRAPRAAIDLVLRVASALDVAHGLGVLHRDLKPSNIFMTAGDVPVVVGFGQWTRPTRSNQPDAAAYIAPEQITGPPDAANPQSDIYSLGVILYQLLTGQTPPLRERPSAPVFFPPDLEPQLQDICRKAIAHYADERYRSMADFANDLSRHLQTLSAFESGPRKPLPGSSQRLPLPPSAQPVSEPPTNSVAFAQMQQLRTLSENVAPDAPAVRATRSFAQYRKWGVIGLVAIIALVATLYFLSDNDSSQGKPNTASPATGTPNNTPAPQQPVLEPLDDLLRQLRSAKVADREIAVQKLSARNDVETVDAVSQLIVVEPWPDDNGPAGEIHDAAVRVLIALDAGNVPAVLRRATKSDEFRTRMWAYGELAERIDNNNRPVLQPNFLAGLRDFNPQVRRAVADQIRKNNLNDPGIVQALVARVSDDVWGEPNNSPPENFIHNPAADGGKDAALDALEALEPKRVPEALNAAIKCGNLDVKKWAEHQKKNRDLK
jgi:serine/threonine protein kinase